MFSYWNASAMNAAEAAASDEYNSTVVNFAMSSRIVAPDRHRQAPQQAVRGGPRQRSRSPQRKNLACDPAGKVRTFPITWKQWSVAETADNGFRSLFPHGIKGLSAAAMQVARLTTH